MTLFCQLGPVFQVDKTIRTANEDWFESGLAEEFFQFGGQQQRVFLFLLGADLIATILAAVPSGDGDGCDRLARFVFGGKEQGLEDSLQIALGDERRTLMEQDWMGKKEVNAVEFGPERIDFERQAGAAIGQFNFLVLPGNGEMEIIGLGPFFQMEILLTGNRRKEGAALGLAALEAGDKTTG